MQERYETVFGIYNHDQDGADPMALAWTYPAENTSMGSQLQSLVRDFADYEVGKFFQISFKDFMECPRDYCEMMLIEAKRRQAQNEKVAAEQAAKMGQGLPTR